MAETLSVVFIGCGKRARAHAIGVAADQRLRVVGVADINPTAAEAMKADFKFEAARIYADYQPMLADLKPDVVVTSLWTPLHLPVFRDCVAAGVRAVLSEKPMAPTWGEALEMAKLAETSGCQLTFCHQRRFARGNQIVRQVISAGRIGKIERMDLYSPPNLLDCGTHSIDQAMSFNAEQPVKWVLGQVDTSKLLNWFNVQAEGMFVGTLVFANGVRASIQTGGPDADMPTGVRVIGSEGFIEVLWDGEIRKAVRYDEPGWLLGPTEAEHKDEHMIAYVKEAVDALIQKREPELSYQKALRATEAIFAFYESVRQHRRIELPLTGVTDNPFLAQLAAGHFSHAAAAT
jgi:UDP-N-acetyl-2-amino-2-deoxyglucuronate dehydrogenase